MFSISGPRFRQQFAGQAGAPSGSARCLKMRHARLLIERTFLTVAEITTLLGYDDPAQFARDFLTCHGVSPQTLRGTGAATPLPPGTPVDLA